MKRSRFLGSPKTIYNTPGKSDHWDDEGKEECENCVYRNDDDGLYEGQKDKDEVSNPTWRRPF